MWSGVTRAQENAPTGGRPLTSHFSSLPIKISAARPDAKFVRSLPLGQTDINLTVFCLGRNMCSESGWHLGAGLAICYILPTG